MPDDKSLGSKLLGVFFESDPKDATPAEGTEAVPGAPKSAAEIVAELAGTAAPRPVPAARTTAAPPPRAAPPAAASAPAPVSTLGPLPAAEPAQVDFDEVFRKVGMDVAELDRVRKAEELLKGLPEGTPQEIKRQIVEAALKAFGFDTAKIVTSAQGQQKALETWVRLNEQQTEKALADAKAKIAQLEDQVIGLRADIEKKKLNLAGLSAAAQGRAAQVSRVLEFFRGSQPPAPPQKA